MTENISLYKHIFLTILLLIDWFLNLASVYSAVINNRKSPCILIGSVNLGIYYENEYGSLSEN